MRREKIDRGEVSKINQQRNVVRDMEIQIHLLMNCSHMLTDRS